MNAIRYHAKQQRYRCLANRAFWVAGPQSDIELSSKACELWRKADSKAAVNLEFKL